MFTHETQIRVRYGETDQMGFVYYGNYAEYYEIGRVEALRSLGISYADLEKDHSIIMPVMSMHARFLRPARYDDILNIQTSILHLPIRDIVFVSEIHNENGKLLNAGRITLCFLEAKTQKRIEVPAFIREKLGPYFETENSH